MNKPLRRIGKAIQYLYESVGSFFKPQEVTHKYALAIVAIIKNEGEYIEEWVKYHLLAGVEKIYLYDNDSDDNTGVILNPYIQKGKVELIPFPGKARQLPAYNDALRRFGKECRYIAFIDADEFLVSCDSKRLLPDALDEIILLDKKAGGVAVNWRMFGSSGHLQKPPCGGVLENYLYRAQDDGKGNYCIKSVVRPQRTFRFRSDHYPVYLLGYHAIDENGNCVKGWYNKIDKTRNIQLNHYFTKSKQEWIVRRSMGKADTADENDKRTLDDFYAYDNNDVLDDSMLYYAKRIKDMEI